MKKLFTLFFCSFIVLAQAQVPQSISYQGVARNTTGVVLSNQAIAVKFELHQGSTGGTIVFNEIHNVSTNSFGLFTLLIGSVNTTGFTSINWGSGSYFLEVSMDPTGGASFVSVGNQQLLSVPYALYAEKAGNASPTPTISINAPNTISNPSTGIYDITVPAATSYTAGNGIDLTGNIITNTAPAVTPTLTVSGNNISINPGNTQTLPTYSLAQSGNNINLIQDGASIATVSVATGTTYTAGTDIDITGNIITNTSPDQIVTITGTDVTGSYPNFSITSPTTSIVSLNNTILGVTQSGNSYTLAPTTQSLSVSVSSITISNGNSVAWPTHSLSLTGNTLSINGPGSNSVTLPANPTTTITQGTNITVSGTAPNYIVSAPNYVLGSFSNSITLTNGVNSSSVAVPVQALALTGTTLSAGPTTNSVNLASLPGNWTLTTGVLYPTILTNSVGVGTSGPLTDKMEINYPSSPTNTHLHLKQTGGDAFSRIKFTNAVAPTKYWLSSVTSDPSDANSGYNFFYHNGTVGRNLFTVAGNGKVSVNPFSVSYPTLFEVNGGIELDSTIAINGLNNMPPASTVNAGKIYYDRASNRFKVSENGGAYVNLLNAPSPWGYNPGVMYPLNNASTDKVAIGQAFANSMLDIMNSVSSTVTAAPVVNIVNNNSSFNAPGVLQINKTTGFGALLYATNTYSTGDGLSVNMSNANNGSTGVQVTHNGTGYAGFFGVSNASSGADALVVNTNGSGKVINAITTGSGQAGNFFINNTSNGSIAFNAKTIGTGDALFAEQGGTSGRSGVFVTYNNSNTSATLFSQTAGLGTAGFFENINTSSNNNAVTAVTYGTGSTVFGNNMGTGGHAGYFNIPGGSTNTASALFASNIASGNALDAQSGVGYAVYATNSSSLNAAVYGNNSGSGNAIYGMNNSNTTAAGYFYNTGSYDGVGAYSNGGRAVYAQSSSTSGFSGIEGIHYGNGTGLLLTKPAGSSGSIARFNNVEATNSSDAVWVTNSGTGHGLLVTKPGGVTAGNAARFENLSSGNSADAVMIINNGVGAAMHAASGTATTSALALLVDNGHIKTTMTPATLSKVDIASSTLSNFIGSPTDVAGTINIATGQVHTANQQYVRINFAKPYAIAPIVILTAVTSDGAKVAAYVTATANDFIISFANTTVTGPTINFTFNYMVIEGK